MRADSRISRRAFLRRTALGAGALGALSLVGLESCTTSTHAARRTATVTASPSATPIAYRGLHSRPDFEGAPAMKVLASSGKAQDSYLLLTPASGPPPGPAIFDNAGHLIWFHPVAKQAANLQVVRYHGRDLLAWFEGDITNSGYGQGAHVLYDDRYQQVARIESAVGPLDLHELVVTPQGTALIDVYVPKVLDLTPYGGLAGTTVFDCLVQEVDIASGRTLFSWSALDHVGLGESVVQAPTAQGKGYDFFHVNSIDVDTDNNLIVSARNTSAVYKLDRKTGTIIWRLGGAKGATLPAPRITLSPASESFWFQHDVRRMPDGGLSIFDDGGQPYHHDGRGLILDVDERAGTASVRKAYGTELKLHVDYQGSFRQQPNGDWLVGWGDIGRLTEYTVDGEVALDAEFGGNSYRVVRGAWRGQPTDAPAIAATRANGRATVWASWNGATDVARWRVLGGADAGSLDEMGTFDWTDFETEMALQGDAAVFAVEALDVAGGVLGRSAPVVA